MNRKSTIGMVLLVAMVLSKAFLFDYKDKQVAFVGVDASVKDVDAISERAGSLTHTSTRTDLIAAHFNAPVLSEFEVKETNNPGNDAFVSQYQIEEIAVISSGDQVDNAVIPMDYASNTGYGLWKSSTVEARDRPADEKGIEGRVPLDHGNTITGDISRLFPRNP